MAINWKAFTSEIVITDVVQALTTQTELFVVYAEHYANALRKRTQARWNMEKVEAIVKDGVRNSTTDEKGKTLSDAKITAIMIQDLDYMKARDEYLNAETNETELRLIMDAINIRKDMLRSLSANRREELANRGFGVDDDEFIRMKATLEKLSSSLGIGQAQVEVVKGQNN